MPFIPQEPRAFTASGIGWLNPGQTGVYGIFRPNHWIYVGKSDDIRRRLLEHLNGDNPCILSHQPTLFVAEVIAYPDAREKELIRELHPPCNHQIG